MTLSDLAKIVNDAVAVCRSAGGNPDKTDVEVVYDDEIDPVGGDEARLEEFPDDEETYREHVRVGGEREFCFLIRTGVRP